MRDVEGVLAGLFCKSTSRFVNKCSRISGQSSIPKTKESLDLSRPS